MDSDGDAVVLVGSDLWLFNPAALEDMSGGEATSRRGETLPTSPGKLLTSKRQKRVYVPRDITRYNSSSFAF